MLVVKNISSEMYDIVTENERKASLQLNEYAKLYLMTIMKNLIEKEDFFYKNIINDDALGEAFMKAFAKDLFGKIQTIKAVGDLCLIYSGLFPDKLNRKLVDIDYFIKLGQVSFLTLYRIYNHIDTLSDIKNLYLNVYKEFLKITSVLMEIAKSFRLIDEENILKIYERWQKTKINALYNILKAKNIIPLDYNSDKAN
ncbi:MAG: hypothetical protein N3C60_00785 [Calditerrivibrio sp.]|nr:hypothetical protein [Calditerrivibrio sp.]